MNEEIKRILDNAKHKVFWKKWGPYLSERQWGTVREDYSANGDAWSYFPFWHAHRRAYRWGEDGIGGICDIKCNLCFAPAFWNGRDPILKERLFGLNGHEGNHCEDVKELYYYLDNTPTHSYMKYLYKYPQREFPYIKLIEENKKRTRLDTEFEILDTGVFDDNRYFDIFIEYAKASPEHILIKISIFNRAKEKAELTLIPTMWFRNLWSFIKGVQKPTIRIHNKEKEHITLIAKSQELGSYYLHAQMPDKILFTENETNFYKLYGVKNKSPYTKDAFEESIIYGKDLLNGKEDGTKAGLVYQLEISAGKCSVLKLYLSNEVKKEPFGEEFDKIFSKRKLEADEFYQNFYPNVASQDIKNVQRQAFAGLLWNKQYYNYEIETWLKGDELQPPPPPERSKVRNFDWPYLFNRDVILMPDKWEYPWYAAWDLAFHCIAMAPIDPDFAKKQLLLLLREWYMHPNGQIPAYEWKLEDVNPPVHGFAALKVYEIERELYGAGDINFLKRVFHKLLLNFTWWVNKKDAHGRNIFQGGFLGLDNIGVFDRSGVLPGGAHIEQADATSWMAMYSLNLMEMALEIAKFDPSYEDVASKFFEHFVHIAESLNTYGGFGLWDEEDGFYYDMLHLPDNREIPLKVRSLVGIVPLFAVSVIEREQFNTLKGFKKRLMWFRENRIKQKKYVAIEELYSNSDILLSLVPKRRLTLVLKRLFDKQEFLSKGGIRSLSKYHEKNPYVLKIQGQQYSVGYEPAESRTGLFGGNSNWRGPIWIPINYLLIESFKKYGKYYGDDFKVEFPTNSKRHLTLSEVAKQLAQMISNIFLKDEKGVRAVHGQEKLYISDPYFKDLVLFYEYFHGDTCKGLGASHQTGWTALVAEMIRWCWCE